MFVLAIDINFFIHILSLEIQIHQDRKLVERQRRNHTISRIPCSMSHSSGFSGTKPHMKTLSGSSTSNDGRKSILKNKDPETEQLIPEPPPETESTKDKSFPVKFATFSDDEGNDNGRKLQKKLPSSPLPNRKIPRAPLADLVADFAGQDSRGNSEENLLNDTMLDHQNANTVLRCSRPNCRLNAPASNSSLSQDPLMSKQRIPVCMCGAVMTRVPAESVSDQTLSTSLTNVSSALNTTTELESEPTTSASTTEIDKSADKRKDSFLPPILSQSADKNHTDSNGKKAASQILVTDDPLSPENLNDDCSTFVGSNSDETKLIQRSSIQRQSDS